MVRADSGKGYRIKYLPSAQRDLKSLDVNLRKRIMRKIDIDLIHRPYKFPVLEGEFEGCRRLRVGDYRVVFSIERKVVLIERIGHRKEVYKY
ncbi:type II toxin-antitoxin system RelE/ParE family toxin [Desulfobacterota bacterium AH_259_B03_O07]|nr:type II toxin-antitoxin system RelE/ParE family toxin [Desulfobacterota bacterium AH_259_B03_O07]